MSKPNHVDLRLFELAQHLSPEYVQWLQRASAHDQGNVVYLSAHEVSRETVTAWVAQVQREPDSLLFAVMCDKRHVGNVRLHRIPEDPHALYIGILIDPEQQGRGLATAAIRVLAEGAIQSGLGRVIRARAYIDNLASIRAFENAGFVVAKTGVWSEVSPPREYALLQYDARGSEF